MKSTENGIAIFAKMCQDFAAKIGQAEQLLRGELIVRDGTIKQTEFRLEQARADETLEASLRLEIRTQRSNLSRNNIRFLNSTKNSNTCIVDSLF